MAEQIAVRYGVPRWYSDVAAMLDAEKPDVLHITTPPQSHLALTRQAVAAGCHIFLEKPSRCVIALLSHRRGSGCRRKKARRQLLAQL